MNSTNNFVFTEKNVGIGTTNPSYNLHVKGNGQILSIDGDQDGHCYQAFLIGGSRKAYLGFPDNGSQILTIKNEYSKNRINIKLSSLSIVLGIISTFLLFALI